MSLKEAIFFRRNQFLLRLLYKNDDNIKTILKFYNYNMKTIIFNLKDFYNLHDKQI